MATEDIGTLRAAVVADVEGFRSEMIRVSRQLESNTARMNAALSRVDSGVSRLSSGFRTAGRIAAAFGLALSARSIIDFTKRTLDAGDQLFALSQRLNVTVESLSELQYVARLADVEFDAMRTSLEFMVKTLGEAQRGARESVDAFGELGVDFRAIAALPVDQQFETIAEALSRVEDETLQVALAQRVFSRGGTQMLQATRDGAAGIRELRQEARDYGAVMSTEAARATANATDEIDRMKAAAGGLALALGAQLAPKIADVADALRRGFFPSAAERALDAAKLDLEDRSRLLAKARQDLAAYEAALATHPDIIEKGQADRLEELRHRVSLLRSEVYDAETELRRLLALPSSTQDSSRVPGLTTAGAGLLDTSNFVKEAEGPTAILAERLEAAEWMRDYEADLIAEVRKEQESLTEFLNEQQEERAKVAKEMARERAAAEQFVAEETRAWTFYAAESAVNVLHMVGTEHRAAAFAAIALEKAMAIQRILITGKLASAQIIAHGEVAAWNAMAQLGPFMGPPAAAAISAAATADAARVMAMSVTSAVFTGVGGLIEAARISSGRNVLDSSVGPRSSSGALSSPDAAGGSVAASHRRSVVEVHFHGDLIGWDRHIEERVISGIRKAVDEKDVVIFGRSSRQAQMLTERL